MMILDVEANQVSIVVLPRRTRRQATLTGLRVATSMTANVIIVETAAELTRNASDTSSWWTQVWHCTKTLCFASHVTLVDRLKCGSGLKLCVLLHTLHWLTDWSVSVDWNFVFCFTHYTGWRTEVCQWTETLCFASHVTLVDGLKCGSGLKLCVLLHTLHWLTEWSVSVHWNFVFCCIHYVLGMDDKYGVSLWI